ncbi:MAG TPA: dihydroorotate dehydrogenase-like protein [Acidobacteriaceae bacterium]|jgi:dihydroorotate dehydrogenase (fumarate)|nr:dihydroorotate dehydrogenase-like protein [Acidobacteriaceae bacterium]
MIDFSTRYLGLKLNGPIVVSSTPLSESLDNIRRMEDVGASAIVLTSLFEEQLALESRALDEDLSRGTESFAESLDYLPDQSDYRMTQDVYLEHLRRAKAAVKIPIIASLNGNTVGGWVRFAKEMESAGADAIELNTYALATDSSQTSSEIEIRVLELVEKVCQEVKVPVSVKLSQSFTTLPHLVARLQDAGARGVVLFNRFYQPDFDIETLEVRPTLHFSTPSELLPRLHWAAILYGHLNIDLAITGGVHSAEDVLKSIMAGANMTMMASALHIHGIEHIGRVLSDMQYWLEKREYTSLWETRGCLSRRSVPDTSPFDRGNYIKTLSSYSLRQTVAAF